MDTTAKQYEWDETVPDHAPDLYDYAGVTSTLQGFDEVDEQAITLYHQQGFLAIENAFDAQEVKDGIAGLVDLIAEKNPKFSLIQFQSGVKENLASLSLDERLNNVRKIGQFTDYDERLKQLAFHPKLITVVEKILGANAELYQSMALIKPPRGREKPWHQDHAYFLLAPQVKVVGVWIALDEATAENGCMRVVPGAHQSTLYPHWQMRDWQIADDDAQTFKSKSLAVPLRPGGCMIFDSYIPHGTPSNYSQHPRKALQYHYLPTNTSRISSEERLKIWSGAERAK